MSIHRRARVVAVIVMLCCMVGVAWSQERNAGARVQAGQGEVSVEVDTNRPGGQATQGIAHRATEIQGMMVKNEADKELGTVNDIVIDVPAGVVKYAALEYDPSLGGNDKLFAMPWHVFDHRHDAKSDEHSLVLAIDEQALKNAPSFDQSEWPDFADPKFADEIERYYGKFSTQQDRQDTASADRGVGVDIRAGRAGRVGVEVDVRRNGQLHRSRQGSSENDMVLRASEIMDMTVKNPADKELGSVKDLVIDLDTGNVRYAALSYGGFLGFGDKLFAVPFRSFDCQYNASEKEYYLVLDVDEATLQKAPSFDPDKWPDFGDPAFGQDIDKYYENSPQSSDQSGDGGERRPTE